MLLPTYLHLLEAKLCVFNGLLIGNLAPQYNAVCTPAITEQKALSNNKKPEQVSPFRLDS